MDEYKNCFKDCKYNPLTTKTKILKRYPELLIFPEFSVDYGTEKDVNLNTDSILRFALLFYQKNTLSEIEPSFLKRKRICAELAGFEIDPETNEFSARVESVLLGKSPVVNKLFVRVLQMSNDILFEEYMTFQGLRARQMLKLESDKTGRNEKLKDVVDLVDGLTKRLKEIEIDILKEDRSTLLREELYQTAVYNSLPTPEEIAKAKKDGTLNKIIDSEYDEEEHSAITFGGTKELK